MAIILSRNPGTKRGTKRKHKTRGQSQASDLTKRHATNSSPNTTDPENHQSMVHIAKIHTNSPVMSSSGSLGAHIIRRRQSSWQHVIFLKACQPKKTLLSFRGLIKFPLFLRAIPICGPACCCILATHYQGYSGICPQTKRTLNLRLSTSTERTTTAIQNIRFMNTSISVSVVASSEASSFRRPWFLKVDTDSFLNLQKSQILNVDKYLFTFS